MQSMVTQRGGSVQVCPDATWPSDKAKRKAETFWPRIASSIFVCTSLSRCTQVAQVAG